MKRYYISKIKLVEMGAGITAWTHRAAEYPDLNLTGAIDEIHVDPQTGIPTQKFVLCMIDKKDHRPFVDDPEMSDFPDASLNVKVSAIDKASTNKSKAKMRALGMTKDEVDEAWDKADGMADVINRLGRKNKPEFDVLNFDAPD
jgi:hypothetical protein